MPREPLKLFLAGTNDAPLIYFKDHSRSTPLYPDNPCRIPGELKQEEILDELLDLCDTARQTKGAVRGEALHKMIARLNRNFYTPQDFIPPHLAQSDPHRFLLGGFAFMGMCNLFGFRYLIDEHIVEYAKRNEEYFGAESFRKIDCVLFNESLKAFIIIDWKSGVSHSQSSAVSLWAYHNYYRCANEAGVMVYPIIIMNESFEYQAAKLDQDSRSFRHLIQNDEMFATLAQYSEIYQKLHKLFGAHPDYFNSILALCGIVGRHSDIFLYSNEKFTYLVFERYNSKKVLCVALSTTDRITRSEREAQLSFVQNVLKASSDVACMTLMSYFICVPTAIYQTDSPEETFSLFTRFIGDNTYNMVRLLPLLTDRTKGQAWPNLLDLMLSFKNGYALVDRQSVPPSKLNFTKTVNIDQTDITRTDLPLIFAELTANCYGSLDGVTFYEKPRRTHELEHAPRKGEKLQVQMSQGEVTKKVTFGSDELKFIPNRKEEDLEQKRQQQRAQKREQDETDELMSLMDGIDKLSIGRTERIEYPPQNKHQELLLRHQKQDVQYLFRNQPQSGRNQSGMIQQQQQQQQLQPSRNQSGNQQDVQPSRNQSGNQQDVQPSRNQSGNQQDVQPSRNQSDVTRNEIQSSKFSKSQQQQQQYYPSPVPFNDREETKVDLSGKVKPSTNQNNVKALLRTPGSRTNQTNQPFKGTNRMNESYSKPESKRQADTQTKPQSNYMEKYAEDYVSDYTYADNYAGSYAGRADKYPDSHPKSERYSELRAQRDQRDPFMARSYLEQNPSQKGETTIAPKKKVGGRGAALFQIDPALIQPKGRGGGGGGPTQPERK